MHQTWAVLSPGADTFGADVVVTGANAAALLLVAATDDRAFSTRRL